MRRSLLAAFTIGAGTALWITADHASDLSSRNAGLGLRPDHRFHRRGRRGCANDVVCGTGPADRPRRARRPLRSGPLGPGRRTLPHAAPANKLVNNPAGESGITQSEVSIAVAGDKIVVGWNDGQGFVDGSNLTGVGYSTDRGETWTDQGDLDGQAGVGVFGDPTIAALPGNRWVAVSLDRGNASGIAVNIGDFSGGVPVWQNAYAYGDGGASLDKEYIEYDETTGRLYMSYVAFPSGTTRGRLTYSTDGGATWPRRSP